MHQIVLHTKITTDLCGIDGIICCNGIIYDSITGKQISIIEYLPRNARTADKYMVLFAINRDNKYMKYVPDMANIKLG